MKRCFFSIIVSVILLCGCSGEGQVSNYNKELNSGNERITTATGEQSGGLKRGISAWSNIFKVSIDETTQEIKYGYILDDYIVYNGDELELGLSITIDVPSMQEEKIEAVAMMVIDGQLCSFSIEGGQKDITHKITLENRKEERRLINFIPSMIEKDNKAEWVIIVVPMLESYGHTLDEVVVVTYNKQILSNVDKKVNGENAFCSEDYYFDTAKNVYGKELHDICPYNGTILNYIIEDKGGNWNYMSEYTKGKMRVLLFCDGVLYNGFNESYGLFIEKEEQELVHKQIDITKLSEGRHKIFAVVMHYDENNNLKAVYKSLTGEIIVID